MFFWQLLVTDIAMATLILFFTYIYIQNLCTDINQSFRIYLLQRELEWISFSAINGNMASFFLFLDLYFVGSLYSVPLHGLELIHLSAICDIKCCTATPFSVSWT